MKVGFAAGNVGHLLKEVFFLTYKFPIGRAQTDAQIQRNGRLRLGNVIR